MGHQSRIRKQRKEASLASNSDALKTVTDKLAIKMLADIAESAVETTPDGRIRQDWAARRAAGVEIARRTGLLPAFMMAARGGPLDIPPLWPNADIVPMGGGPGFLDVNVRTLHPTKGRVESCIRMALPAGTKPTEEMIGTAYERGRFHLKKKIEA